MTGDDKQRRQSVVDELSTSSRRRDDGNQRVCILRARRRALLVEIAMHSPTPRSNSATSRHPSPRQSVIRGPSSVVMTTRKKNARRLLAPCTLSNLRLQAAPHRTVYPVAPSPLYRPLARHFTRHVAISGPPVPEPTFESKPRPKPRARRLRLYSLLRQRCAGRYAAAAAAVAEVFFSPAVGMINLFARATARGER